MSYSTITYGVDIDRLRAVFGSDDRALLDAIEAEQAADLDENEAWFEDEIASGAPTLRQALEQIVAGAVTGPASAGFQYAYATEALCRRLGVRLEDTEDSLGFLDDLGFDFRLRTSRLPLPLPLPLDFPSVGYLNTAEVVEEHARFVAAGPGGDRVSDARAELTERLKQASEQGLGLVAFTY